MNTFPRNMGAQNSILALGFGVSFALIANAQVTVRSGAGNLAAVTAVRDQFRVDLGGGTTAGANGSFGGLRREVNWDGVPAGSSAPNALPANFFNVTSPRGILLVPSPGGTTFQVSGNTTDAGAGQPAAANFGNINASYTSAFQSFSAQRLFTALGNRNYEVRFFLPGTTTPALVSGFGAIFSDVDVADTTVIQIFGANGESLFSSAAQPASSGFSFLGYFSSNGQAVISRALISPGNTAAGPNDNNASSDIVFADDFIYGEPVINPTIYRDGFE
jgi:hypothetical protein